MRKIEWKIATLVEDCMSGKHTKSFDRVLSRDRWGHVRDQVTYDAGSKTAKVFLFGSCIFTVAQATRLFDGAVSGLAQIDDCDCRTATTKSRLNAMLKAFHPDNTSLFQRDYTWHISRISVIDGEVTSELATFKGSFTFTTVKFNAKSYGHPDDMRLAI
jgi:hypothetical protein|tara:strand:- start:1197 stop:1673 length:477 start_codon:yes stop_codon:yes gene_type:complete